MARKSTRPKPSPVGCRRIPKMTLHRATGQAVVRLGGRDCYLGKWGTDAARAAYHRRIAEWLAAGPLIAGAEQGQRPESLTELASLYWQYICANYPRDQRCQIKAALRYATRLYADLPIADFGPVALKAVRTTMVQDRTIGTRDPETGQRALARTTINKHTRRLCAMVRWGVENELVDGSAFHRLSAVEPLRRGRGGRESRKRRPVAWRDLRAVKPHLRPQVWRMALLQYLTGMRSGELVAMRSVDIEREGRPIWVYRPEHHKTENRGRARAVAVGPLAQRILRPLVTADSAEPIFRPRDVVDELMAERTSRRRLPKWPSHDPARRRKKGRKLRRPGRAYSVHAYWRAIARACKAAGVVPWTPHELRHACATRVRARFGLDAARAVLGHAGAGVTLEYAHLDLRKAAEAMGKLG